MTYLVEVKIQIGYRHRRIRWYLTMIFARRGAGSSCSHSSRSRRPCWIRSESVICCSLRLYVDAVMENTECFSSSYVLHMGILLSGRCERKEIKMALSLLFCSYWRRNERRWGWAITVTWKLGPNGWLVRHSLHRRKWPLNCGRRSYMKQRHTKYFREHRGL